MSDALSRFAAGAAVACIVGAALCVAGALMAPHELYPAYLAGYSFWLGLSLGSALLSMTIVLTGGRWGAAVAPLAASGAALLPWMVPLFIPVVLGLERLYPWARPELAVGHLTSYLSVPFWLARAGGYFAVWIAFARLATRGPAHAGVGLVAYLLTMTLAATDWILSLDPDWSSTMMGLLVVVGDALSAFAFAIVAGIALAWRHRRGSGAALHDLGNLLLAFVMLWAYLSYSQYLIVWSGGLPREAAAYVRRASEGWRVVPVVLVALHFVLPFTLLLSRRIKRSLHFLGAIAALVLAMRILDLSWWVLPLSRPDGPHLRWTDVGVALGLGGFWLAAWTREARRRPLEASRALADGSAHGEL